MTTAYRQLQRGSAIFAILGCFIQIIFQFCLAVGVPWGVAAWGGQHIGTLPSSLRIASAFGVLLWIFILSIVLQKISKIFDGARMAGDRITDNIRIRPCQCFSPGFVRCTIWVLCVLLALATVENFASRSSVERWTWGPFLLVLFISFVVLARSTPNDANDGGGGGDGGGEDSHLLPDSTIV